MQMGSIVSSSSLKRLPVRLLPVLAAILISACGGGGGSSGTADVTAPPASSPPPPAPVNSAPSISGTATGQAVVGAAYTFTPGASDPDGDTLTFSVANKPKWATLVTSTGELRGTPAASDIGTYANILITVSDGKVSTPLSGFTITVAAASATTGSANVSWLPPTTNTDGSTLMGLAGYRIYYGTSAASLSASVDVKNPGLTSYLIDNLSSGTYFFAVSAYDSAGRESAPSSPVSKTIS